ncbi:PREDICTED: olfactory receptor 12-like [Condylura cristata]|uniref:olfactory receptor 12-like n=1 Tax=Condylura cristata TaxID=143302 RepID=UPI000642F125|nr:PREDICTED: olfactory receptor 12-like [Condylura cristata]
MTRSADPRGARRHCSWRVLAGSGLRTLVLLSVVRPRTPRRPLGLRVAGGQAVCRGLRTFGQRADHGVPPPSASPGPQSGASLQDFVLLGFAGGVHTQALLFALFLGLYVATVLGNLTMIVVITLDARLHSPMYFFLKNLSFVDLCYSSVIAPNALANFFSPSKTITFMGCATQFFLFSLFGTTEAFLLAVMAYDRFMAICRPLRYPVTMCPSACARLVLGTYCGGCINTLVQTSFTFTLPFCGSRRVDHFFCDVPPLLPLACADTTLNQLVMFGVCGLIIVGTSLVVLVSYGYIAGTILRVHSGAARHKVFSTCGSHMTAVCLFYGTVFVMYAQPGAVASMEQGKVVSVFYTLVIPMLNPLIYSLRNKDVKEALRRLGQRPAAGELGGTRRAGPRGRQ